MTAHSHTVRIFMLPQQFPCGPQSSCCGPIGQSDEVIQNLTSIIQRELGCPVEVINIQDGKMMRNHLHIVRLIHAFGPAATPIIALDDEVISLGTPAPAQAIGAIKARMNQAQAR